MELNNLNWDKFNSILSSGTKEELHEFINSNNLVIKDGKIYPKDEYSCKEAIGYWDKIQTVSKLNLNGSYGSLLNSGCKFFDLRLGQSTTLSGRQVVKHMTSKVNETVTGSYDHVGGSVIYGDSVTGDSVILTNSGNITIEELYTQCKDTDKAYTNDREYKVNSPHKVMGFNIHNDQPVMAEIAYVMRHKTTKNIYNVILQNGKSIKVTEDHSVMVDRAGYTMDVKPLDLLDTDLLMCLTDTNKFKIDRTTIKEVVCLGNLDDYVYDISVEDQDPVFFANNILVSNTDSVYFTAYPTFKPMIDSGQMEWTRDTVIELYDAISDEVNATFPGFMTHAFHCPTSRGEVIKAGREIVAIKGLFITKKRYAVLYYDKDGKRQDLNGKTGKLKAMGLDLKRSDTPVYMQEFMSDLLLKVLTGTGEEESLRLISEFRTSFKNKSGWEKGSPKRANNITSYRDKDVKGGKVTMPGQVRASLNWNTLRRMNKDTQSLEIVDGMKVIVCKLKLNQMGFTSVAFPVDEPHLPQWFTELPFDHAEMETVIVDNKLDNLLCVLSWDLNSTIETNTFKSLFDF